MFCSECGAQLKEGAVFCNNCGTRINHAVDQVSVSNTYNTNAIVGNNLVEKKQINIASIDKKKLALLVGAVAIVIIIGILIVSGALKSSAKRDADNCIKMIDDQMREIEGVFESGLENGFKDLFYNTLRVSRSDKLDKLIESNVSKGMSALSAGRSKVVYEVTEQTSDRIVIKTTVSNATIDCGIKDFASYMFSFIGGGVSNIWSGLASIIDSYDEDPYTWVSNILDQIWDSVAEERRNSGTVTGTGYWVFEKKDKKWVMSESSDVKDFLSAWMGISRLDYAISDLIN